MSDRAESLKIPSFTEARPAEPAQALSMRANFSWTFIGNLVYRGAQWGMLVVLAKLLSPEAVGRYALGLAVTSPVMLFTDLQVRDIVITDAKHEHSFSDYLTLRILTTFVGLGIIAAIAALADYPRETIAVILLVGLSKAVQSISDIFYALFQQRERMNLMAISMMIKGPLALVGLAVGVFLTDSVVWGVAGLVVAWTLALLIYDVPAGAHVLNLPYAQVNGNGPIRARERLRLRWRPRALAQVAWTALPLGIVMMLLSLNTSIPRFFIERYWGERELGIFAAVSYLMVAGTMIVNALGQSASPRLARFYATGMRHRFTRLLSQLIGIVTLLGVAGLLLAVVAGRPLLTLIYSPEYSEHLTMFLWVTVAAVLGFVGSICGYTMTAARFFRVQTPLFVLVTLVTAGTSLWLIPQYGLTGAALALVASSGVQLVGSALIVAYAIRRAPRPAE